MIRGMTGFGSAQVVMGKVKALVEIKSVNHRYLDITYYLPIGFGSIENNIRDIIQEQMDRGRITVSIKIVNKPIQAIAINKEVVQQYFKYSHSLKKDFKLQGELSLSDLIRLPGVVETKEILVGPQEIWPALEKGIRRSLAELMLMRKSEGKSLVADVSDKLKKMLSQLKLIEQRTAKILSEQKKKVTSDEFSSFQKGMDINEEVSRLTHHIEETKKLVLTNVAIGKKMDFIAQEMQRETNTIGSKVQDNLVTNSVIALKSKIEKIREQAQNIE